MARQILTNKPLLEAIFELRWELAAVAGQKGLSTDPNYKILIGSLYERIRDQYPYHEQLPSATIPDEIAPYVVQHRFRKDQNGYPLVQIGPGVVTLNDTTGYVWEDFQNRISGLLKNIFSVYPRAETDLVINKVLLRYIDALDFDYDRGNVFSFLKDNMKLKIDVDKILFNGTGVNESPVGVDLRMAFPSTRPQGAVQLRFARGKKGSSDALIWETRLVTPEGNAPRTREGVVAWVQEAHSLTDDWFFKTISEELLARFR
jgi:uncharacterized protein (TIGR04255 family)